MPPERENALSFRGDRVEGGRACPNGGCARWRGSAGSLWRVVGSAAIAIASFYKRQTHYVFGALAGCAAIRVLRAAMGSQGLAIVGLGVVTIAARHVSAMNRAWPTLVPSWAQPRS